MDDELVLLTSYFNLTGGRRQDTADTFRVEPNMPSASSPEGAALYIVTESSASGHMGPRARRRAADVVAWEYSSRNDLAPAPRLKAALQAAHEAVLGEFDGHVAVGLSVMVVERDTVFLGQVAPAQVFVLHEGGLHSIAAAGPGRSPYSQALGSTAGPEVSVFRDQIGSEDVVVLCSSWFQRHTEPDELRECFSGETADDIAECLLSLAKQHEVREVTGIVVEALPARQVEDQLAEQDSPGLMDQVDSAVQALTGVGRMLWSELRPQRGQADPNGRKAPSDAEIEERGVDRPVAQSAAVEVEAPPDLAGSNDPSHSPSEPEVLSPTWTPPPQEEVGSGAAPEQATDEVPIVPSPQDRDGESTTSEDARESSKYHATFEVPSPEELGSTSGARPLASQPTSEIERVNSRIQSDPELGDVIPPVQAFPDTSTEPERIYATSRDIQAVNKRPRRFGGIGGTARTDVSSGSHVIRPQLGNLSLSRPAGRPAPPLVIWVAAAAAFLLVAGSLYLFLQHRHTTRANPYPARVTRDLTLATKQTAPNQQDFYLTKARRDLRLAKDNGTSARRLAALRGQIGTTADSLHKVVRVASPVLLSDFTRFPGAQPTELAAGNGHIFVLDSKRKEVVSITPNSTSNPAVIVQAGDQVSGFTVGTPSRLTTDGATALVLDDKNVLVRDNVGTRTATSLTEQAPRETIAAMATADPDVYLLDSTNNQLWRYPNAVNFFNPNPQGFFSPTPTNLGHVVSFVFDRADVYILRSDGLVNKYDIIQANPQKWNKTLRTPLNSPVAIFASPSANAVWIADPNNKRIVQLDKSGGYVRTYQSGASNMDFGQIKSISTDPGGATMYVLCGSKVFDFRIASH